MGCFLASLGALLALQIRLSRAQSDGVVGGNDFLRRAYHSSVVVGDYVYVDGGEYSMRQQDQANVALGWTGSTLTIPLSQSWTNASVVMGAIPKPSWVPSFDEGGLWTDGSTIYTGFAGRISSLSRSAASPPDMGVWALKPDNKGSGAWEVAVDSKDSQLANIHRPMVPAVSAGNGVGYALGGMYSPSTTPNVMPGDAPGFLNQTGMLRFDMRNRTITNTTNWGTPRLKSGLQYAEMEYVPNFGQHGIYVVLGGDTLPYNKLIGGADHHFLEWSTVTIFDPAKDKWYDQETSGDIPKGRSQFCSAGVKSDKGTFEIFVYAGWGGTFGDSSNQYDEIFVLTLPGFHWSRVDYPASHTRHAFSCNSVGGSQILVIGGANTALTNSDSVTDPNAKPFADKDNLVQGLGIFDLHSLGWSDGYVTNAPAYTQSAPVAQYYASNPNGPKFKSVELATLFGSNNIDKTAAAPSASPSSSPSNSTNPSTKPLQDLSTSAIAGISVGTSVGVVLLGALILVFLSQRKKRRLQRGDGYIDHDDDDTASDRAKIITSPRSPPTPTSPTSMYSKSDFGAAAYHHRHFMDDSTPMPAVLRGPMVSPESDDLEHEHEHQQRLGQPWHTLNSHTYLPPPPVPPISKQRGLARDGML